MKVAINVPFDVPTWTEHLNTQDPLALVIRGHLYVEAALIQKIEAALVNKQGFDTAALSFVLKVKFAVALGKVDPADVGALTVLNRFRVRFAHDLKTQLNDQDELDLHNALSPQQRTLVDSLRKPTLPFIGRLRCDILGLILRLHRSGA
jgi:hypothetical protein